MPGGHVADVLRMLASRLKEQRQAGSRYYIGDALTAVDISSATSMAMFVPLPPEQCQIDGPTRAALESRDPQIEAAFDPILFQHRDMIFAREIGAAAIALTPLSVEFVGTDARTSRSAASCHKRTNV